MRYVVKRFAKLLSESSVGYKFDKLPENAERPHPRTVVAARRWGRTHDRRKGDGGQLGEINDEHVVTAQQVTAQHLAMAVQ